MLLILITKMETTPFSALLVFTLAAMLLYGWRTFRIAAIGTQDGIEVRNLLSTRTYEWQEIQSMDVGPSQKGGGFGINLTLTDGETESIEASWGPWYSGRGRLTSEHAQACERWIADLRAVASGYLGD